MSPANPSDVRGPLLKPNIMRHLTLSWQAEAFLSLLPLKRCREPCYSSNGVPCSLLVLWVFWANTLIQSHSALYMELVPSAAERGSVNRENRRSHLLKICRWTNSIHHHWHHWFSQSGWLVSRHNASQTHGLGLGNQETTIFFFLPSSLLSFFFFF